MFYMTDKVLSTLVRAPGTLVRLDQILGIEKDLFWPKRSFGVDGDQEAPPLTLLEPTLFHGTPKCNLVEMLPWCLVG
jgi:hypothetical protein